MMPNETALAQGSRILTIIANDVLQRTEAEALSCPVRDELLVRSCVSAFKLAEASGNKEVSAILGRVVAEFMTIDADQYIDSMLEAARADMDHGWSPGHP